MSPEDKGLAIGSTPELARAHNRRARPDTRREAARQQQQASRNSHLPSAPAATAHQRQAAGRADAFHFVCYVPVCGRLYELDGLKQAPIDHGPLPSSSANGFGWTARFGEVIRARLGMNGGAGGEPYHDIRFNLMAVVPDRRLQLHEQLRTLHTNRNIIRDTLDKLASADGGHSVQTLAATRGSSLELDSLLESPLKVEVGVIQQPGEVLVTRCDSLAGTDVTKPLTIETRFEQQAATSPAVQVSPTDSCASGGSGGSGSAPLTRSKYPTRSSTKRDTLASNSLASARANITGSPSGGGGQQSSPGLASCSELQLLAAEGASAPLGGSSVDKNSSGSVK